MRERENEFALVLVALVVALVRIVVFLFWFSLIHNLHRILRAGCLSIAVVCVVVSLLLLLL